MMTEKKLDDGILEVDDVDGCDWERWLLHFTEVEEQERLIKLLKVFSFSFVFSLLF